MNRAFSLIELLVVIAIIGLIAALALPSLTSILGGSQLSLGAESVMGALTTGRQIAVTKQRDVEVRLIEMTDPSWPGSPAAIRAVQIFEIRETGTNAIGKPRIFPSGVIMGSEDGITTLSALPDTTAAAVGAPSIPGIGTSYSYRSFRFRPDGSMNLKSLLAPAVTNYFLTLYDEKSQSQVSGTKPPDNFATIKLEPSTGAATLYRP